MSASLYSTMMLASGTPLDEVERQFRGFEKTIASNRMDSLILLAAPSIVALRCLRGMPADDSCIDFDEIVQKAEKQGQFVARDVAKLNRLVAAYIMKEYDVVDTVVSELHFGRLLPGTNGMSSHIFCRCFDHQFSCPVHNLNTLHFSRLPCFQASLFRRRSCIGAGPTRDCARTLEEHAFSETRNSAASWLCKAEPSQHPWHAVLAPS